MQYTRIEYDLDKLTITSKRSISLLQHSRTEANFGGAQVDSFNLLVYITSPKKKIKLPKKIPCYKKN